jgi:5'-nucleotidase
MSYITILQALGNHEFDDSIQGILPYMEGLVSPIVAVNMDVSAVPELQGKYQPSIVIQRENHSIGIIGCITKDTPVSGLNV